MQQGLSKLDHLLHGLARKRVETLANGLLMVISKVKPLRILSSATGLLKPGLRYAT
jgi:hypothetical protein